MTEPESRFFESMRLRLHYVVWGDETKPPLILVHGGRDHARSWDFVAARLIDRFAVYALDLRGHGESDWSTGSAYHLSDNVADLARLVQVLDRGPVNLVGHSMGGRLVLDYGAIYPEHVQKIVAIEGFGRVRFTRTPLQRLRGYVDYIRELEERTPRSYPTLDDAIARMHDANRHLTPEVARHLTEHAVLRQEDGSYVWKFDNYVRLQSPTEWDNEETRALWGAIKAPTLHIGGSESWGTRFAGRESLAGAIPGSRVVIVKDAAHWVHHDQLNQFVTLVREFFGTEQR
jgi:pimeloyl-ACP methyl ester carboxylesterase